MNKEDKYKETQIKWNMSANEINNNTNKVIEKSKNTYDTISKFNIVDDEIHKFISLLSEEEHFNPVDFFNTPELCPVNFLHNILKCFI